MVPLRTLLASMLALGALGALGACRSKPPPAAEADGAAASAGEAGGDEALAADAEAADEAVIVDASHRFRDAEPKVELDPEGPVDPACSGPEIAFGSVIVDRRCAIGSLRARQLRARLERDGGAGGSAATAVMLRQEAKVAEDGRVVLRLVNAGAASLTLPLSYASKVPAFTVLAEDEQHTIFELEPPRFDVGLPGGPDAAVESARPHFARIVLAPGAAAVATLAIQTGITRTLARGPAAAKCDGGPCAPVRLGKGRYVLHVGELLADIEAGAPARVTFVVP